MLENVKLPLSLRVLVVFVLTLAVLALGTVADDDLTPRVHPSPLAPPAELQLPEPKIVVPTPALRPSEGAHFSPSPPLTSHSSTSPSAHAPPSPPSNSQDNVPEKVSAPEALPSLTVASPRAAIKAAQPIDNVFVPLQQWKERKLQDIESQVKQGTKRTSSKKISNNTDAKRMRRASAGKAQVDHFLSRRQLQFREILWKTCLLVPENSLSVPAGGTVGAADQKIPNAPLNPLPPSTVSQDPSHFPVIKPVTPSAIIASSLSPEVDELTNEPPLSESSPPSYAIEKLPDVSHTHPKAETELQLRTIGDTETDENIPDSESEADALQETLLSIPDAVKPDNSVREKNTRASLLDLKSLGEKVRQLRNTVSTVVKLAPSIADTCALFNSSSNRSSNSSLFCAASANPRNTSETKVPGSTEIATPNSSAYTARKRKKSDTLMSKGGNLQKEKKFDGADATATATATATAKTSSSAKNRRSFNFASEGAGSQILANSQNAVGAKNIITENSDKYMLVPCAGDGVGGSRWVDIELSEYVILKSVQTANYEHYSSAARKFAVLGAENYPPEKWNVLGVFDFANSREIQTFRIPSSASRKVSRFLRVIYAGKHGHEYYCPISIFRAFGKTLIADLKEGLETSAEDIKKKKSLDTRAHSNTKDALKVSITGEKGNANTGVHADNNLSNGSADKNGKEAPLAAHSAAHVENSKLSEGTESDGNIATHKPGGDSNSDLHRGKGELSTDDQIVLNVVREETLSPVSGDDNIFRRVTRMIRLLELNQSLTNQYIDTHLARYAAALAATQSEAAKGAEAAAMAQARVASVAAALERSVNDMRAASLRRDMLLCALLVLIGFLLGTHWVMWTALSGARVATASPLSAPSEQMAETSPISSPEGSALEHGVQKPEGASRIVEVVSADGVLVQLTEARRRRRRGSRRSTPGTPRSPQDASGDALNAQSPSFTSTIASPASARVRTLPPLSAASPRRARRLYNSNSFQLLSDATDATRDGNKSDG